MYRASAGTIYPTLQQLEDEGLIASESKEIKRVYRLTDAGGKELDRLHDEVRHIWRRARRWTTGARCSIPMQRRFAARPSGW